MQNKKIAKNYFFNAGYQILSLIVPLVTTPYISRTLGAEGIGIYSFTYSISYYFVLCSVLGTASYGNRLFGVLQDNIIERTKRFWDVFLLRIITSSIAFVVYLVYVLSFSNYKLIATIQSIYIIGVIFDVSWFFQGLEEFKKIAIRNYVIKIINIIYVFAFIKSSDDLWKYVFGLAFLTLAGNISIWVYLPRYLVKIKYKPYPFKDFISIIQLFIPTVATQVYEMMDKSMIGWMTGLAAENGYYEQAGKIVRMCLMLITALNSVMIPQLSKAYASNNSNELKKGIYNSYNFVWFLAIPLMLGLIAITPIFVPVFFGDGFEKVKSLLPIFSLLFILMGLNSTTGSLYFITTQQQSKYTKFILCGGLVNLLLNAILIPKLLSIGAAVASVIGELVILVLELAYVARKKDYKLSVVFSLSYKYIVSGVLMFCILIFVRKYMITSWTSLLFLICLGVFCYFFVLLCEKEKIVCIGIKKFFRK